VSIITYVFNPTIVIQAFFRACDNKVCIQTKELIYLFFYRNTSDFFDRINQ